MTLAQAFAAHACSLAWRELPGNVHEAARIFLLDTLAVGVAGAGAPFADAVLASETQASCGTAGILGRARATSPRAAAFINAYQIHAQEFDCVHEPAVLHPCSAVLGALIAECTASPGVSGARFGAAFVAGVDIAVSLGLAGTGPLTFFRPAVTGIFGAAAAVAAVRGFSPAQYVDVFGHALAFASGTMQAHVEGTPGLALQVAAAARNALAACDLAQQGLPGASQSFDGPFGFFGLFERQHDIPPILARLGQQFAITELSHKPYPTGRAAHGGIAAVQVLMRDFAVRASDVAALRYEAPSLIARLVGRPAHAGMRVAYARLCLPYLAARTLLHGTAGLDAFSPEALGNQAILSLAAKIQVTVDSNPDLAAFTPARLHADLSDGRQISVPMKALAGSPAAPLDAAARLRKVEECLAFAGINLQAAALAACIADMDTEPDMARLFSLVCTGAG